MIGSSIYGIMNAKACAEYEPEHTPNAKETPGMGSARADDGRQAA